jgi:cytochrome P450
MGQQELLDAAIRSSEGRGDPYVFLRELVDHGDSFIDADQRAWAFGYELASSILRSPMMAKRGIHGAQSFPRFTPEQEEQLKSERPADLGFLPSLDPPDHTRLRRLVNLAYTPKATDALAPVMREVLEDLIAAVDPHDEIDLIQSFAEPFPAQVIGHLIGLPLSSRDAFAALARESAPAFDSAAPFEVVLAGLRARRRSLEYMSDLLEDRRRSPLGEDLVSALVSLQETGELIRDEAELVSLVTTMYGAGFQTTMHMLTNGIVLFLRNPEQADALRSNPSLATQATNEVLRVDTPIMNAGYITAERTQIGDLVLEEAQHVTVMLGTANHDRRVFDNPGRFDVTQKRRRQPLSFGSGQHHCLGASLARMEGEVFFATLLTRFPRMRLVGEPTRLDSFRMRGYEAARVVLEPRAARSF